MTPPRPTAPTAAELRERFLVRCAQDQEIHDDSRVEFAGALDALMAAVRAEVLEEAAKVADRFGVEWRLYGHVTESIAARIRALVSK